MEGHEGAATLSPPVSSNWHGVGYVHEGMVRVIRYEDAFQGRADADVEQYFQPGTPGLPANYRAYHTNRRQRIALRINRHDIQGGNGTRACPEEILTPVAEHFYLHPMRLGS